MNSQQLNRRVRIEHQAAAADSFTAQSWHLIDEVWGSVLPVRSSEARLADAQQAYLTHTLAVRWSAALAVPVDSAQWRIVYTDRGLVRKLAIVGPGRDLQSAGQWLIFDCVEGLADGH